MRCAVIIVTYNASQWLKKCILPLNKDAPKGMKVYVVDNGSTDGTKEIINNLCSTFILIQLKNNVGFGKANNIGIKKALEDGCTYFLLLNQDAYISWCGVKELYTIHKRNEEYGIISPLQLYSENEVDFLHLKSLMKSGNLLFNDLLTGKKKQELYEIGYTNAAIWMISKDCLKRVGGFDPLFFHYGEDTEYAQRVNYFGFKVGIAINSKGYHYRSQIKALNKNSKFHYYNTFLIRVKDLTTDAHFQLLRILGELIRSSISTLFGYRGLASKASMSALLQILKNWSQILENRTESCKNRYSFLNFMEEEPTTEQSCLQ